MKTRDKIINFIAEHGSVSGKEISEYLSLTRQAINKHIKKLIESGLIVKSGNTRSTQYHIRKATTEIRMMESLKRTYLLQNLEEDIVFNEVSMLLNLSKRLTKKAYEIIRYSFTEILNNAIEHSYSEKCSIKIALDNFNCSFTIT